MTSWISIRPERPSISGPSGSELFFTEVKFISQQDKNKKGVGVTRVLYRNTAKDEDMKFNSLIDKV